MPEIEGGGIPVPSPAPSEQEAAAPGEITCVYVVVDAIDGVWHRVEPMLKEAINGMELQTQMEGIDDIFLKLMGGQYDLWLCLRDGHVLAAVVLRVTEYSRCFVVDILYGAGLDLEHWLGPFYDTIVDRSRAIGCKFIRVCGREGWGKPLKKFGFKKAYVAFMCRI